MKEIIKKRVEELELGLGKVEEDNQQRLMLIKSFEAYLKKVVLIHNKIKELDGSNLLAANEREFLVRNIFFFQTFVTLLLIIGFFIALKKEEKNALEIFERNFWLNFKKYIFNFNSDNGEYVVSSNFDDKAEEYRDFIEKNIAFNKLFKATIPQKVFVFDVGKNVIFHNRDSSYVGDVNQINTYKEFVSYFNIGDMIRDADKYSFSFEKDSSWYTVYYEVKEVEDNIMSIAYVMKVDSKVVGELEDAKERVIKIEGLLDEVLNKNDNISFDNFVNDQKDSFGRIENKAKRVVTLFEKAEGSYINQIQDLEVVHFLHHRM